MAVDSWSPRWASTVVIVDSPEEREPLGLLMAVACHCVVQRKLGV